MIIQKTITTFLCCLFLCSASSLFSQKLLQRIPEDATMVIAFHPSSINKKVDMNALKQLDFCKALMQETAKEINAEQSGVIFDALNNPAQYGLDVLSDSYFFMKADDDGSTYFSYILPLTNASLFADFFKNNLLKAEQGIHIKTENGVSYAISNDGVVAWNEEMAIFTAGTVKWDQGYTDPYGYEEYPEEEYDYSEEDYTYEEEEEYTYDEEEMIEEEDQIEAEPTEPEMEEEVVIEEIPDGGIEEVEEWVDEDVEELEEEPFADDWGNGESYEAYKAREAAAVEVFATSLFADLEDGSILDNQNYRKQLQKKKDVSMWLDYSYITKMGMTDDPYMDAYTKMFLNKLAGLYTDSYLSLDMNFDPGAIELDYDLYMNKAWMNYLRAAVDAKINRKFFKYIKGENLLGYMSTSYNIENMFTEGKKLMMPTLEAIPYAGHFAPEIIDIIGIAIDEEALYNFFKGDFCFAVTGMRDFDMTYTSYDYDDEFNRTEKQETRTQSLPEFVMMLSYGSEENLTKFFRLGEKMGGIQKQGNYYTIAAPTSGMNLYLAYHKGILFFSNDDDLVKNKLTSGYGCKRRIKKEHRKMMQENAVVVYWDLPKSFNAASTLGMPFGRSGERVFNVSKQSLESIQMTSSKTIGDSMHTDLSFRFVNKKMNSLEQLFNFINEIYLAETQGQSM